MLDKLAIVLGVCLLATSAALAAPTPEQLQMLNQLTPEQIQQLQQLTPEQRNALMRQQGGGGGNQAVPASPPITIQPRSVEFGRLEREIRTPTADARQAATEVTASPRLEVPVEQASTQQIADRVEIRRAFEAFLKESKPLSVSTEGLQQFGYDLFAGQPNSFTPVTDVPVPPEYVLGPGDEIKVQMFGKDARDLVLTVDREGMVAFPQIGPITVAGLNFAQAKALLAEQIKQKLIGVSASITMGQLRSIRVFALGDVYRPGSYTVSGLATLSHALYASGGVKKIGSLRNIELKRNGKRIATLDLYDFLLRGNTSKDVRLQPGDVVFVPPIGMTVAIAGEVVRPGIYEILAEKTVGDLLKLAGGLMPGAYTNKVLIERFNPKGDKQVVNIDLSAKGMDAAIRNGDVVKVFPATEFETNQVLLLGNVKRPGKYAWHPGFRVSDLLQGRDDLLPESFLDYGVIESEAEDTREPLLTRFKLGELLDKGATAEANVMLKPRDKVYVFHRGNFRQQPKIEVVGSVQTPGGYELKRNMKLVDAILAAGGLNRDADSEWVEVYRTDPLSKTISLLKFDISQALEGNVGADVLLQDQDRIVVHSIYERKQRQVVSISGEVNKPGEFPLTEGMRVSDLIFAAGNVTQTALLTKAEITRYEVINGERREALHFEVDLAGVLRGDASANVELKPFDNLHIRKIGNWRKAEKIEIFGEVAHPGVYPVEEGERLSSVLKRAGGYTKEAYLPAAVFTRESVRVEQQKQIDDLIVRLESQLSAMQIPVSQIRDAALQQHRQEGLSVAQRVLSQLRTVKATGRMVIKLADIAKLENSSFDIQLRDGDKLYIPKRPDEVLVLGEVYNQSAFVFDPKKDRDDYVEDAGPTRMSDLDGVYIVRADGRVEVKDRGWWRNASIEPGDAIVVPVNLSYFNLLDTVLDWSRATMQIGTSLATMKVIGIF